jgi:hypothetical protein
MKLGLRLSAHYGFGRNASTDVISLNAGACLGIAFNVIALNGRACVCVALDRPGDLKSLVAFDGTNFTDDVDFIDAGRNTFLLLHPVDPYIAADNGEVTSGGDRSPPLVTSPLVRIPDKILSNFLPNILIS